MENVEKLLKLYQGARAVVSYRLHCALPCLALGTSVILLNEDYRNDRFGDYTKYIESCHETDFINGTVKYDYRNIPIHSDEWKKLRENLIKRCQDFVATGEKDEGSYQNDINIRDYKKYVISKSNWLKEACIESYQRFEKVKQKQKQEEEELKEKYQKELEEREKETIRNKQEKEYYQKEFEECVQKMEKYQSELEAIKNSKWWKMREKIKKDGKKDGEEQE